MVAPGGRRLTLSPIGFDVILALSQAPDGLRLAAISQVIGSPVSSVQTSLRVLVSNDLIRREGAETPRYVLSPDHPAQSALASTSTLIGDAAHAIAIILRANSAVAWAAVDSGGFLVGISPDAQPGAVERLDRHLELVAGGRPDSPDVLRMPMPDFERLARVALELRDRARRAVTIKGRAPGAADPVGTQPGSRTG
jgi:hypothetical protein